MVLDFIVVRQAVLMFRRIVCTINIVLIAMLLLLGHGGGTDCTYASGFGCLVFSMDIN
jgi:hypothetical protein